MVTQDDLINCLALSISLTSVHINFPLEAPGEIPAMLPAEALDVVQRCPSTITLFGCNSRVWRVRRSFEYMGVHAAHSILYYIKVGWEATQHGNPQEDVVQRVLLPYDRLEIPEQFQIVKV